MTNDKRLYDAVSLAGPLIDRGLKAGDAEALLGLLLLPARAIFDTLSSIDGWKSRQAIELIPEIIERDGLYLKNVAQLVLWQRRKLNYEADKASWLKADVGTGWRKQPMSLGQKYLVQSTAAILLIEIPVGMDRGSASDWLDTHMAHLVLMIDNEFKGN